MKLNNLRQLIKEELTKALNENLIPEKYTIADILEKADIPDEEFTPQRKSTAVYFMREGRPSEFYLNKIVDILKKYDVDVSAIYAPKPEPKPYVPSGTPSRINPYDDKPSRGYMGAKYRGD